LLCSILVNFIIIRIILPPHPQAASRPGPHRAIAGESMLGAAGFYS
jgi:hypothetical protein